jgi:FkbM family methyltransferase
MVQGRTGDTEKTEAQVLEMASSLCFTRTLTPYPKRIQEHDWMHRSLAGYVREAIWKFFYDRNRDVPFEMPWHRELKLRLNLGNELSRGLFVDGCYDANEFAFLDSILRPGMHFMDIGAHEGLYTLFASRCVGDNGHVWSFEPSSRERTGLARNIELNRLNNVSVLPSAVAEADGNGELKVANAVRSGHNTLGDAVWEGVRLCESEAVPLRSLDSVAAEKQFNRLDFVKIDAEGAEMRIINGASRVLREFRPILLFEAQDSSLRQQGGCLDGLLTAIRSHDYRICAFDPDTGLPTAEPGPEDLNLLAIPQERLPA